MRNRYYSLLGSSLHNSKPLSLIHPNVCAGNAFPTFSVHLIPLSIAQLISPPPWSLPVFHPSAPPRHPDSLPKQASWQAPHWLTANINAKCPKIKTNITLYNAAKNPLKKRSSLHGVTSTCVVASRVWKNRATETFKQT